MSILSLSVKAPWAWAIFELPDAWWKCVENRDWPTDYRGPVLIHVSSSCSAAIQNQAVFSIYEATRELGRTELIQVTPFKRMQVGGIVGAVDIVDCVTGYTSPWRNGQRFGFMLANRRKCKFTPCRGNERFFRPAAEIVDALRIAS
jgi:hypothetical protein